ncbi:MAG: hypothetical protein ACE5O2_16850 [Armatimonadota bacterium]
MNRKPSSPDGVLVRDLLTDLVAAVAAADHTLEDAGAPFVIPSAKVSAEFVVGFDRTKRRGFLVWARASGSHSQSRASVQLVLTAAPPHANGPPTA